MKKTTLRVILVLAAILVIVAAVLAVRGRNGSAAPESYAMAQVAEASSTARCWVAIEGGVYDFTPYAAKDASIVSLCGTDATETVKRLGSGASDAFDSARIGELAR